MAQLNPDRKGAPFLCASSDPVRTHVSLHTTQPPPTHQGPWELVASSSSSELDEAEDADDHNQNQAPTYVAPLPLHYPPHPLLLPWAAAAATTTSLLLPRDSSSTRGSSLSLSDSSSIGGRYRRRGRLQNRLARLLFWPPPIARWLPRYTRHQAVGDLLGGVTVAVMVVPQGNSAGCGSTLTYNIYTLYILYIYVYIAAT